MTLELVRTGRIVHDNWKILLVGQGFADHQWTEVDGTTFSERPNSAILQCCNLPKDKHLEEMVDWEYLPSEVQDEYERIAHGDLEAAAAVTNRTLGRTTSVRHMGTLRVTGQVIVSLLQPGRRCFEVLTSPIPPNARFVDLCRPEGVSPDPVDGAWFDLTVEHPDLPSVANGCKAPYMNLPVITMPLCVECDCCLSKDLTN